MQEHEPFGLDDLTALERRLRGWRPDGRGLDRDRMLFEAGRAASGRDGRARLARLAWPVVAAVAACFAVAVGLAWHSERSRREALETELAQRGPGPSAEGDAVATSLAQQQGGLEPSPVVSSYLYLTRHLDSSGSVRIGPTGTEPTGGSTPGTGRRAPDRDSLPLRPRDFDRLITL